MEALVIKKDKVLEAAEACPEARKTLETLFPEVFCESYVSGDMFFHMQRHCEEHCMKSESEIKDLRISLSDNKIRLLSYDLPKFTYLLAHLKNAKEYGLFNLHNGYQLRRNEVYLRKHDVGIMIPKEHLQGLIKIRSGGGK